MLFVLKNGVVQGVETQSGNNQADSGWAEDAICAVEHALGAPSIPRVLVTMAGGGWAEDAMCAVCCFSVGFRSSSRVATAGCITP